MLRLLSSPFGLLAVPLILCFSARTGAVDERLPFFAFDNCLKHPPSELAALLEKLGYDGLSTSGHQVGPLLKELRSRGLTLFNTYLTPHFDAATNALTDPLRALIDDLRDTGAALWIAPTRVTQNGKAFPNSSPEGDAIALARLREIVDYAEPRGVRIALYPHTWFWLERFEDGVRLAKKMNRSSVGATFNLCHWLKVEGDRDPIPVISAALPRLFFASVNGADGGDTRAMDWNRLIQPLDRGSYDVAALITRLRSIGYRGPIGLQCYGIGGEPREHLARSMAAWRKMTAPASPTSSSKPTSQLRSKALRLELSDAGEIAGAFITAEQHGRALQAWTVLAHCTNEGPVAMRRSDRGGLEYSRTVRHTWLDHRALVLDRFLPAKDSVRWEIEVHGQGAPWSTPIETHLRWPATRETRFWTAWEDPRQKRGDWRDPLELQPLRNTHLWYGAVRWDAPDRLPTFPITRGDAFVIPLVTVAEPHADAALSVALSPEDVMLDLGLAVREEGSFAFSRQSHRISVTNIVRFAMDLVPHAADWRGGLDWMTRRYPAFFDPPNARAHQIAGLGAYSDWEGALDVATLKRMGFRVNWKASYDFPYMGLFLPPIADDQKYTRLVKSNQTSIAQLRDYSRRMKSAGFHVLNYFNVTEFGATTGMPQEADPSLAPAERWRNVHNFMRDVVGDGVLLDGQGRRYPSWEGCVGMDCGAPKYRAFLLDQARRHIDKLPDSDGICIDRMDWLRANNQLADDGLSWRQGQPIRSLYASWRSLLSEMGPMFHAADKIILVNAMINRTELLRHVDGIFHEFGHQPPDFNGAALQCVRKPCLAWTPDENTLKPDPDAYFQRHLHLGVFPTAPLPANDHTINAGTWADRWYLDYGPLFDALRGKTWVLATRCVEAVAPDAKANLFQVPGGYVVPVTFGGKSNSVKVRLRGGKRLARMRAEALHPGTTERMPVEIARGGRAGELELEVPLQRGCAVVRLTRRSISGSKP